MIPSLVIVLVPVSATPDGTAHPKISAATANTRKIEFVFTVTSCQNLNFVNQIIYLPIYANIFLKIKGLKSVCAVKL